MKTTQLGKLWGVGLGALLLLLPGAPQAGDYPTRGATTDERIERLEREIEQLKRERAAQPPAGTVSKEEVDNAIDTAFKKQKVLAGWQDGFFLQSPNGDFKLKLRGYTQADARFFPFQDGDTGNDSFFLRRVRPCRRGTAPTGSR